MTEFDEAVISYAQSRGEESEQVYQRVDALSTAYRDRMSETQLLDLLNRVKEQDVTK